MHASEAIVLEVTIDRATLSRLLDTPSDARVVVEVRLAGTATADRPARAPSAATSARPAKPADKMRGHLSRADVMERYGVASVTLTKWVAAGRLPPPGVRLSQRRQFWRESVLDDWDARSNRAAVRAAGRGAVAGGGR